ncbi:SNW/SKI-interacting protein A, partial [Cucurbita argyrosperma subsp. sororia]
MGIYEGREIASISASVLFRRVLMVSFFSPMVKIAISNATGRISKSEEEQTSVVKPNPVPPYLKRSGFIPGKVEDFGNGAFLEIHVAPYPLDMGRDKSSKAWIKDPSCYCG